MMDDANGDVELSKFLEDIIEGVDFSRSDSARSDQRPATFWLPTELKEKYDILQGRSKKLFGKKIHEVISTLIDKAYERLDNKAS